MLPRGVQRQLPSCQIHHGLRPRWTVPLCSEPFTALTPPLPPTATKAGSAPQHGGDGTLLPASPGVPRQIPATGGASGCSTLRSPRSLSITPGLPSAPGTAGQPPPSHRPQGSPQTPRDLQLQAQAEHSSWEGDPSLQRGMGEQPQAPGEGHGPRPPHFTPFSVDPFPAQGPIPPQSRACGRGGVVPWPRG